MFFARRILYLSFLVILSLFLFLRITDGQCNFCSSLNNLACVSQTQYQFCVGETPVGSVNNCPDGYVCSITDSVICKLNSGNVVIACANCNVCDASGVFACTGRQTYALCLGSATPSNIINSCPQNYVCNIELPEICGATASGVLPTCLTTDDETVSPLTHPKQYCQNLGQYGRFSVGRDTSSTCRQYVFCVSRSGSWTGQLYTCPGRTYFNSVSRLCVDAVPENCS